MNAQTHPSSHALPGLFQAGDRCGVMGIINCTPDSFSDGGSYASVQHAVEHGRQLAAAGAEWLDVGGESTRPGAASVAADTEQERVVPVISGLKQALPGIRISIDTTKAAVAAAALEAGAVMVNDISGGVNTELLELTAAAGAGLVCMHMQGTPRTMQQNPQYTNVVDEVCAFLNQAKTRALDAGISSASLLLDPGIGFGKDLTHNCQLLQQLPYLQQQVQQPLLLGVSRKSMLVRLMQRELDNPTRDQLSHIVHALAAPYCRIMRVHDVRGCNDALRLAAAVQPQLDNGVLA